MIKKFNKIPTTQIYITHSDQGWQYQMKRIPVEGKIKQKVCPERKLFE
jgi:hypothetical protein